MSDVVSVADQITDLGAPVGALVLNAAVAVHAPDVTSDGFGINYSTNVLGPLLLERRLEPHFAADARVVVVGSSQHARVKRLDLDTVPARASYTESKLLVMLVARELSRRTDAASVSIADPGFVRTNLGRHAGGGFALMLRLTRAFQDDPDHAAATSVWLATEPGATARNGGHFANSAPASVSRLARDEGLAQRAFDQALDLLARWI